MPTDLPEWIRRLNKLLAEDVMHGIQWCDLSDGEQADFTRMADAGYTPAEALSSMMEGPL